MTTPTIEARNAFLDRIATRFQKLGWQQCNNGGCQGPNCLNGAIIWTSTLPEDCAAAHYATQAIVAVLPDGMGIITWNDIPGRMLCDVLFLLDKAKYQPFILESKD